MHSVALNGFRLSPQQRRVWLSQERSAVNFCAQSAARLDGVLDHARLRRAIARSVERHEILRTGFRRLPGVRVPVQVVADGAEFEWREVDLRDRAPEERETLAAAALAAERERRFELEADAPLRAALVRLTEDSHVLALTLPSVCADRRTLRNLLAEVGRDYDAGAQPVVGESDGDGPVQYAQYAEWLNELRTQEEEAKAGRQFWDAQLDGAGSAQARLGFERAQETRETFAPASLGVEVAREVWARLARLAEEHSVTREALLLACWQTLLWRLTGRAPFAIGFLAEGREHEMLRDAAGAVASWLPAPSAVAGSLSLPEALPRVERTLRDAREWQEFFVMEKCPAAIEGAAGVAETGFLPLAFEYHEAPEPLRAGGIDFSPLGEFCLDQRFDLKLACVGGADGLACELHYNAARYDAVDARRLARQLRALLENIAARPSAPLGEVEIQSGEDLRQLLDEFNRTERDFPRDACLHTLFERQAERTPDNVAAALEESRLSFAGLNAEANRWAHRLRGLGVGPDVPVGLCAERSVEMIVGLLAILKAGGAYVPLDPRQPAARLALLLEETGVPVLLTQSELLPRLPATAARVLSLDADRDSVAGESAENPAGAASPDNLAYIIYTSGSTGRPKGVMVQHRSVVNLITALREAVYARRAPHDAPLRVSLNAPLVFDASVKQLVQLLEGHALHVIPDAARADASALLAYARRHRLDVLDCTPSQLRLLLAAPEEELKSLPGVLLVGGEALDEATWARLAARGNTSAYNVYGPTECTVDATVAPVRAGDAPSIGRPVANARAYILDERMRPVPVGVGGELYIGGEGVARGYFARPDLTAERFVPDPFAAGPGARLYRTGDLARYRADGRIEYLGRADDQVKLRGYRVELGEIEAVLGSCEGVRECVAVVREEPGGDARLVAYLTAETRGADGSRAEPPGVARVREQARARLPEYMIPSAFVVLEKMPLTPNGKVDRRALPAPDSERPETGVSYVAPRDRNEETVARIWQEVLGVERVGVNDNFFDLGGHSLLMVQVHSRLRETFRKEIAMVELFRHPTVGALARHLADESGQQTSFRKTYDRASRRREAANRQTRMKEDKSDE